VAYAVNNKVLFQPDPAGLSLDAKLPTPDLPLEKSLVFKAPSPRGILLYVHGCDGAHPPSRAWISYYNARGLTVIIPDSFAEARPPMQCPPLRADQLRDQNTTLRVRLAQTKRTIHELRRQYKKLPIFVHGQSEGGAIVQALDAKVDGLVVTGHGCGVGESEALLVHKDVPLLVLIGEHDEYVWLPAKERNQKQVSKHCRSVLRSKKWKFAFIPRAGHFPDIWRQQVMDQLSATWGMPSFDLSARTTPPDRTLSADVRGFVEQRYKSVPSNKAMAIGPDGKYAYSSGHISNEDAIQEALYLCDVNASGEKAYSPHGKHECMVHMVNNRPAREIFK
jgi:dienelactone hydrolase